MKILLQTDDDSYRAQITEKVKQLPLVKVTHSATAVVVDFLATPGKTRKGAINAVVGIGATYGIRPYVACPTHGCMQGKKALKHLRYITA